MGKTSNLPTRSENRIEKVAYNKDFSQGACTGSLAVVIGILGVINSIAAIVTNPAGLWTSIALIVIGVILAAWMGHSSAEKGKEERVLRRQRDEQHQRERLEDKEEGKQLRLEDREHQATRDQKFFENQQRLIQEFARSKPAGDPPSPKAIEGDLATIETPKIVPSSTSSVNPDLRFNIEMPFFGEVSDIHCICIWMRIRNLGAKTTLYNWHCKAAFDHESEPYFPPDGEGREIPPANGLVALSHGVTHILREEFISVKLKEKETIDRGEMIDGWIAFSGFEMPELQQFGRISVTCMDTFDTIYELEAIQRPIPEPDPLPPQIQQMFDDGSIEIIDLGDEAP